MSSLASRILGREVLTLEQFAHEVMARLAWEYPEAMVTQPRPDLIAVTHGDGRPSEYTLHPSYRAYQRDPRAKEQEIARFMQWVATALPRRQ